MKIYLRLNIKEIDDQEGTHGKEIKNIPWVSPPSFYHIELLLSLSLSAFVHYKSPRPQDRNLGDILNSSLSPILTLNLSANPMKSTAHYCLDMLTSSNPLDNLEFYLSPVLM